jgi:hypothetical protein
MPGVMAFLFKLLLEAERLVLPAYLPLALSRRERGWRSALPTLTRLDLGAGCRL